MLSILIMSAVYGSNRDIFGLYNATAGILILFLSLIQYIVVSYCE